LTLQQNNHHLDEPTLPTGSTTEISLDEDVGGCHGEGAPYRRFF